MEQLDLSKFGSNPKFSIEHNLYIADQLADLGLKLLRSGKKPGQNVAAYKVVTTNRLTLAEVETFIKHQQRVKQLDWFVQKCGIKLEENGGSD